MRRVEKKCWPEYFKAILAGQKTFELRLNDFKIAPGDVLILREWDPKTKEYTGRSVEKTVGYIGKFKVENIPFWTQEEIRDKGFQIISLK